MASGTAAYRTALQSAGIAGVHVPYDEATIASWNARLDGPFDEQRASGRSYVGADELHELGIFQEIFTAEMRALVADIMPDGVLYHCHSYETAGNQSKPHIAARVLNGWHRDAETIKSYREDALQYVSIFTYLTPVGRDGGAFEFLPRDPTQSFKVGLDSILCLGKPGTTFAWNRSFFHRASPNSSPTRRRLLKLSIQPAGLPNDRIELNEFTRIREAIGDTDPFLSFLLGSERVATSESGRLPRVPADPPEMVAMLPNSKTEAGVVDRLTYQATRLKRAVIPV